MVIWKRRPRPEATRSAELGLIHDPGEDFPGEDIRMKLSTSFVLAVLVGFPVSGAEPELASRLDPLIKAHKGKIAIAVKNLKTGEAFLYNQDEPMPTASLIKLAVMVEAYRQAEEKKIDLGKPVTLKGSDKVPGSGILTSHFSDGATFPLRDAIHLMIVYSDNTATNLVLDEIGLGSTAETMEKMGYPNTKIHSKVFRGSTTIFPDRSKQFGLGSTTAAEMLRLCEALQKKEVVNPEASEAMLAHLRACDDPHKFKRFLPPGTKLAQKTGSVNAARTAAGIIDCAGTPVALCVLTNENEDQSWTDDNAGDKFCAEVAREVFEHFRAQDARGEPKDRDDDAKPR
jgi:beta-lactamase class A